MNDKKKTTLLSDKIADILTTAPTSFDHDNEAFDATNAQIVNEFIEETQEDEEILSKFRRINVDLLADLDEKYAGRKTSRNKSEFEDEYEEENIISDENEESLEESLESEIEKESDVENDLNNEESGNESLVNEEIDSNFKHISDINNSNQIKKGTCVKNQIIIWENLLEIRIQLQKCLLAGNKMPQYEKFNDIKQKCGEKFSNVVNNTKQTLYTTINKLLLLQELVLKQFPETNKLGQEKLDENVEIPSDIEEQIENDEFDEIQRKRRKLEDYEKEIANQHNIYKDYRNKIIQKWNDKTNALVKNSTNSYSILDQIEYSLNDKTKLIKRTQTKRSEYEILGEDKRQDEINCEVFDDEDFYHQLLRELIEVKNTDTTDPVQLSRQWIQLQNLRSKMKRKVDTRATKGRKIRYAIHNKLVNFMAPIEENSLNNEAKNELYNSLFGKNV